MADVDPNEKVTITHPDIDASGTTTRQAFEEVHKHKGWVIASDAPVAPEATQAGADATAATARKR